MRTTLRRSAILLMMLAVSACFPRVKQPEVRLAGIRVGGLGLRGGQIIAQVQITNPNSFALEADEITYDLEVSDPAATSGDRWIDFAEGRFEQDVRIGGGDTLIVEIPIEFTYAALGGAVRSIMERGTFEYRVKGEVKLQEPIGRDIPYRHQGNVSLSGVR